MPTTRREPYETGLDAGREALARGAWAEARAHFGEALAENETPQGFEGLGIAARYESEPASSSRASPRASQAHTCRCCGFNEIGVTANWVGRT